MLHAAYSNFKMHTTTKSIEQKTEQLKSNECALAFIYLAALPLSLPAHLYGAPNLLAQVVNALHYFQNDVGVIGLLQQCESFAYI